MARTVRHKTQISPLDQFHYTVHHYAGMLTEVLQVFTEHNFPLKEPQRTEVKKKTSTEEL